MATITTHASYLSLPLFNQKALIALARTKLKGVKFDTFVARGVSGCIAAPVLARAMRKQFLIVRKDGDGSHSTCRVEGRLGSRWVMVDDLVCTGDTAKAIGNRVAELCRKHAHTTEFMGCLLYDGSGCFRPAEDMQWVVPRPENRPDNWAGFYQAATS